MGRQKNGLWLRGRIWWLVYQHGGTTVRESSHSTRKADAQALLDLRRTASRQGQLVPGVSKVPLGELLMLHVADAIAKHRDPPKLRRLAEYFDVVMDTTDEGTTYSGGWRATAVTYATLQTYVTDRQQAGAADATIANELAALRRSFRLGKKAGKVMVVPEVPMPEVVNVRESYFTIPQLDKLLTLLPVYLRAAVQFAVLTGWRAANVFGLTWEHVDFGRGVVRVPIGRTKSGEPITTPFAHGSALERLLREQERGKAGPYVFHRDGHPIKSYDAAWRSAMTKLGKDGYGAQYDPKTGTTKRVRKRFHDLRHTFAQLMTDAGVPEQAILELGCWKTRSMLERYRIVNEDAKKSAVALRDQYVAQEREKAAKVVPMKQRSA
jgi:integrase